MNMTDPNEPTLAQEILRAISDPGQFPYPDNPKGDRTVSEWSRDAVMQLLVDSGNVLPGCPPAARMLKDAEQFAGQLQLAMLCVRLLRMLNTRIVTPETKGLERWLNDYIDGKNHGPIGKPMLWPGGLPGLSQQLRDWGFQPTPTRPAFVARVAPTAINGTVQ